MLTDPKDTTSERPEETDPLPVLGYATPKPAVDAWKMVKVWAHRLVGLGFMLLGGLIALPSVGMAGRSDELITPDDGPFLFLISCLVMALLGVALSVIGLRWLVIIPRQLLRQ